MIKVDLSVRKALDVFAEKSWMIYFKILFIFVLILANFFLIVRDQMVLAYYKAWDLQKQVIESSYTRIDSIFYFDEYVQIILGLQGGIFNAADLNIGLTSND